MFGTFAGMALLLAAVGLYGVTAYSLSRRTREIGIRTALGARPAQIWWTVTRRASLQVAAGLLLGIAGALAMGRVWQSLVTSTTGTDPVTLAFASLLLIGVASIACLIAAWRAMRMDSAAALRAD
jgi:ABC-type antimicrobial peptide transport system permease subunit